VLLLPLFIDHATVSEAFLVLWGLFLLLAAVILGVALAYVFMTRGLRGPEPAGLAPSGSEGSPPPGAASGPEGPSTIAPDLALRLLTGDERRVYRRIVEAGGALLQRDLVGTGLFSGSKVTRVLDRLEAKGLVSRERHGMTNRIRLSEAWREKA
jgi:hypothetical protein